MVVLEVFPIVCLVIGFICGLVALREYCIERNGSWITKHRRSL